MTDVTGAAVADCSIVVCDGLKGLPDAVAAVWPQTIVQTCIVVEITFDGRLSAGRNQNKKPPR